MAPAKHQRWASSLARFKAVDILGTVPLNTVIPELPDNPSAEGDATTKIDYVLLAKHEPTLQ